LQILEAGGVIEWCMDRAHTLAACIDLNKQRGTDACGHLA